MTSPIIRVLSLYVCVCVCSSLVRFEITELQNFSCLHFSAHFLLQQSVGLVCEPPAVPEVNTRLIKRTLPLLVQHYVSHQRKPKLRYQ